MSIPLCFATVSPDRHPPPFTAGRQNILPMEMMGVPKRRAVIVMLEGIKTKWPFGIQQRDKKEEELEEEEEEKEEEMRDEEERKASGIERKRRKKEN